MKNVGHGKTRFLRFPKDCFVFSPEFQSTRRTSAVGCIQSRLPKILKMADSKGTGTSTPVPDNEEEEMNSRGNGWEVVSLTASAYAAAPGPYGVESVHEEKGNSINEGEAETSQPLFMSKHFVFSPGLHENLPIEHENTVMQKEEKEGEQMITEMHEHGGRSLQKEVENLSIAGLNAPEDFSGVQLFDGKGGRLSVHDMGFDEATSLHGMNIISKEQDIYGCDKYSSFHSETTVDGSIMHDDSAVTSDLTEPIDSCIDPSVCLSQSQEPGKEDKDDASELPSEAWWKRGVACLCAHAKETNAIWSVFIAAAVMGLVILGQRWQQEKQKWQHSLNNEESGKTLPALSRLKDVIIGGGRRGSYLRNSASVDR
ncbi:hypothetical protein Nepgr_002345 [Nepenthes gracilis]|uniref:Uncharacterized protein n=1 Tax=Nepenthes gracilis TaxID=150966 RepID=A0AAD3P634_NEPGR|nr:hypothetical protein Nepgr_002345 [Nepenthes gracilis]